MTFRRKIRIIHTSDTHLGDDWDPDSAQRALSAVVDGVHTLHGDALLIAGDVFDNARISDAVLEFFVSEMARAAVPTVILPGNHDLYDSASLVSAFTLCCRAGQPPRHQRYQGPNFDFPRSEDWRSGAAPWTAIRRRFPTTGRHPGATATATGASPWAHGHFHYPDDTEERSSPIRPHEIAEANCDYIALGHWERFEDVSQNGVTAFYSGSPMGAAGARGKIAVNVVELDVASANRVNVSQAELSLL